MALRTVNDAEGTLWRVWDVIPATRQVTGLEDGWLCFECDHAKRRLTPIPQRWEERTDEELQMYLRAAQVVTRPQRVSHPPQTV
ncbi:MAG: hypothetical protein JWM27_4076 [Gemmatimonadetes bacterium]|nr:hypothetical protein [Gemmatimonadota bacterium]